MAASRGASLQLGRWIVALAATAMMFFGVPTAWATVAGRNGELAYETPNGCFGACADGYPDSQIHVVNPDGTGDHQLTFDAEADSFGAWSPDGSMVLYEGWRSIPTDYGTFTRSWHQYVMRSDGSGAREIVCPFLCGGAAWAPDGRHLLVIGTNASGENLYSVNLDGTSPVQLTHTPAGVALGDPSWSPDGTHIAFVQITGSYPNPSSVWVMNADGTGAHELAVGGAPTFSPDGKMIAYSAGTARGISWVYTVPTAGSPSPVAVAPDPGMNEGSPTFSPDGTEIAFVATSPDGGFGPFNFYILAARLPVQLPAGATPSSACVDGYHVILHGDVEGASWGSYQPLAGARAEPAAQACPSSAPAPQPSPSTTIEQRTTTRIHSDGGVVSVDIKLPAAANGTLHVTARQRRHRLRALRGAKRSHAHVYRFRIRGTTPVTVIVRFVGVPRSSSFTITRTVPTRA